jgi:hypothetical protein
MIYCKLCGIPIKFHGKKCGSAHAQDTLDITNHGLYKIKIEKGLNGWQAGFIIDHQGFWMESNIHAAPEENTREYAELQARCLATALDRLIRKSVKRDVE